MSRRYAAAKAVAVGPPRDELVLEQRDWLRERDRRCIAARSFQELSGPATALRHQAYECLSRCYLDRPRALQDSGLAPWTPTRLTEIDLRSAERRVGKACVRTV